MKAKLLTLVCALAVGFATATPARAGDQGSAAVIVDTVVARPACFVATVVGSAVFVLSLPFAAASKSIKSTAHTLVVSPAQATFTRPLGDLDALIDWE